MSHLPSGLTEALRLGTPWASWLALLIAFGLAALFWLLRRLFRRRASERPRPASTPPPAVPAALEGFAAAIAAIEEEASRSGDFRRACHRLAAALRDHFEGRGKDAGRGARRFSVLTAREIAASVGDAAVAALFELVAELQFRRRRPSYGELAEACELARELAAGARPGRRR